MTHRGIRTHYLDNNVLHYIYSTLKCCLSTLMTTSRFELFQSYQGNTSYNINNIRSLAMELIFKCHNGPTT